MTKKNLIKILSKQNINLAFVLFSFLLAIYLSWSFEMVALLASSVYLLLSDFHPNLYRKVAILSGIISALALAINSQSISEKLGAVSFISLIIFLVFLALEIRRTRNQV